MTEIAGFAAKYDTALKAVRQIREKAGHENDADLLKQFPAEMSAELRRQHIERYRVALNQAVAALQDDASH